jgi:glycosyltransferase involved in cell wall biosynthesis
MKKKGVSIIICCFNSSNRIVEVLSFISKQILIEKFSIEIIVIDNASNDNTSEIVRLQIDKYKDLSINLLYESRPGLMYAREKGIQASKFEYLLFCDDDNLLCDTYISGMFNIMESDENIGVCGGKGIELIRDFKKPDWFDTYKRSFAIGSQIREPQIGLYGAGMCLRFSALKQIFDSGFVSFLTGRRGNSLLAGDDGELVLAILISGFKVKANDDFYFYHLIEKKRLTKEYLNKMFFGFGMMYPVIKIYTLYINQGKVRSLFRYKIIFLIDTVKSFIYAISKSGLHRKIYLSYVLGILKGICLFNKDISQISNVVNSISNKNKNL